MQTIKIFLASSNELANDRRDFEIFVGRQNKHWVKKDTFLELIVWEDFLDALSQTRLQNEYNQAIKECHIFVMLFFTKVGQYTEEEFETAVGQFKATNKPFIYTYFKQMKNDTSFASPNDVDSVQAFQTKLKELGHFYTTYPNIERLQLHFGQQLDKLADNGFMQFSMNADDTAPSGYQVSEGAVVIYGPNSGNINTGTQTNINSVGGAYVGGNINVHNGDFVGRDKITHQSSPGELSQLLEPLFTVIAQTAPVNQRDAAQQQAEQLQTELAKGKQTSDNTMAKIIEGLVEKIPGAASALVSLFASPVLKGLAGQVTQYVLAKFKTD